MKKKVLCIALALLMCMMVITPTLADNDNEVQQERALVSVSFGLKHLSGSSYKMWAKINNPNTVSVSATLALYDASYNYIASVSLTSTNMIINLSKHVTLSSGTYHLRLNYKVNGTTHSTERTYSI